MLSVEEAAKNAVHEAQVQAFVCRQEAARNAEKERVARESVEGTVELQSSLIGKTVIAASFDAANEGTVELTFSDGAKFQATASGDDATSLCWGLVKEKKDA